MMDEGYMRVKQVSAKIGMSEDWVRRFFGEIEGVRKVKSPAKRFKRPYTILLIPAAMFQSVIRKSKLPDCSMGSKPNHSKSFVPLSSPCSRSALWHPNSLRPCHLEPSAAI